MIELLAAMVILGILMVIAIPSVMNVLYNNRSKTYVEDAKKLAVMAEYKIKGNTSGFIKPTDGHCLVMNLAYLDNSEFEEPPNGGEYMKDESFVVVKNNGNKYEYYVQLLEDVKPGTSPRGISLVKSTELYKEGSTELVKNIKSSLIFKLSGMRFVYGADNTNLAKGFAGKIGTSVVDCGTNASPKVTYIYAIE